MQIQQIKAKILRSKNNFNWRARIPGHHREKSHRFHALHVIPLNFLLIVTLIDSDFYAERWSTGRVSQVEYATLEQILVAKYEQEREAAKPQTVPSSMVIINYFNLIWYHNSN